MDLSRRIRKAAGFWRSGLLALAFVAWRTGVAEQQQARRPSSLLAVRCTLRCDALCAVRCTLCGAMQSMQCDAVLRLAEQGLAAALRSN